MSHLEPVNFTGQLSMRFQTRVLLIVLFCIPLACNENKPVATKPTETQSATPPTESASSLVEKLVGSEELILGLSKRMSALNRSCRNLEIPSGQSNSLFDSNAMVYGLTGEFEKEEISSYLTKQVWLINKQPAEIGASGIWQEFLDNVFRVEAARFYLINGHIDEDTDTFEAKMGFAAHVYSRNGEFAHASAKIKATWSFAENNRHPDEMKLSKWKTLSFETVHSAKKMFAEVMDQCIDDDALKQELSNSMHEELTRRLIVGETVDRRPGQAYHLLFPEVTLEHPAVSVVDVDNDGLDDFFVGRQHLPSLFFRNVGNGKFEEIGNRIGLRFRYDCTTALFADFDNDGDKDVFIGRARDRAVYLENDQGYFVEQTLERVGAELPYMVSSISSTDYDKNGLLDVYFCTYSPIESAAGVVQRGEKLWVKHFLSTDHFSEFHQRLSAGHRFTNMAGPPNLLLKNTGTQFQVSEHDAAVQSWHKSFQSTWCDFDQDGDQDLYVCNDFAPDDLFENTGDGFVRINEKAGLNKLGFGMGASFGDHNNDGKFDLYVSNMYSKAGTRITDQIEDIDPKLKEMAAGNFLYEQQDGKFVLVSGKDQPQESVAITGWSWGGQFSDFDNDGKSDIFVANGYYTAPNGVVGNVDL